MDYTEQLAKDAKALGIWNPHHHTSDEFMVNLSYRVDQAIALTEERLEELKKLRDRYSR